MRPPPKLDQLADFFKQESNNAQNCENAPKWVIFFNICFSKIWGVTEPQSNCQFRNGLSCRIGLCITLPNWQQASPSQCGWKGLWQKGPGSNLASISVNFQRQWHKDVRHWRFFLKRNWGLLEAGWGHPPPLFNDWACPSTRPLCDLFGYDVGSVNPFFFRNLTLL